MTNPSRPSLLQARVGDAPAAVAASPLTAATAPDLTVKSCDDSTKGIKFVAGGWTQEQSDALKIHVEAGLSYSQAAVKINARFGTDYSRNAAIGRANRIGLAAPAKEKKPHQKRIYKPRLRIVASNGNSNQKRVIHVPDAELYQTIDDEALDLAARHISFAELTSTRCKWPYGDGPFTFCGCEKPAEGPYCHGHQLRSQRFKYHIEISDEERARRSENFLVVSRKGYIPRRSGAFS